LRIAGFSGFVRGCLMGGWWWEEERGISNCRMYGRCIKVPQQGRECKRFIKNPCKNIYLCAINQYKQEYYGANPN
jgi:hypothetical protein